MKKKYIIVSIISVLIMMIGFSFAYFTSNVNGTGKEMNVSSKRLAIIFTDTKEIAEVDINPGWSTSKTFTVENRSGEVFYYDINIDDLINTFVTEGYLQYKITSTDGGYNMNDFIDIPKSEEARREKLASNIEIENEKTHTYTIEFKYPNDPNVNQSDDMGRVLSGSLSITESNIVVVKYKVDGIIQDEIPDKTEPYIVDKVECSNNAKGVWNEITEKVDFETEVTQTVCIVEFKEGNTITMSTEHGEVVSPVRKVVGRIGSTTFEIEEKAGYNLNDAAIVCDNGAEGSIANKTITITNIKQNNTCKVITNPISMTVTYDVNGGNAISPSSKSVIYTSTYGSLPTPTRTGYTFSGWYTAASGGSKVTEDTEVTNTSSHTIYARWTANTYTVTYNQNGGSGVSPASNTVTYAGKYKLPTTNPSRAGYTFANWWTEATNGTEITTNTQVTNASNHSIYAHWNANTITLTLNNQSATTAGSANVYYKYNTNTYYSNSTLSTTITKITVPAKTGYTFGGYYTSTNGEGTQYIKADGTFVNNPYTAIKTNTTLYAKWTANTYTVTYNQNNGSGVSPASNTVTFAGKYKLPTTSPSRTGYTFAGWFTSLDGGTEVTTSTNVTNASNHSIYAHWKINTYKVTLTVNNGSTTSTNPQTINYNSSASFTIKANSGYKLASPTTKSCTGGTLNYNETTGVLTVLGVTKAISCTITLVQSKVTFTITDPTNKVYDDSGACYISYNNLTTVTYDGKTYTNCIINSKTYSAYFSGGYLHWDPAAGWVFAGRDSDKEYHYNTTTCTVSLTCG